MYSPPFQCITVQILAGCLVEDQALEESPLPRLALGGHFPPPHLVLYAKDKGIEFGGVV